MWVHGATRSVSLVTWFGVGGLAQLRVALPPGDLEMVYEGRVLSPGETLAGAGMPDTSECPIGVVAVASCFLQCGLG